MAAKKKKSTAKKSNAKNKAAPKRRTHAPKKAAPKKPAPKKPAPKKPAPKGGTSKRPARRDATGHLNPEYAKDLRERSLASRDDSNNDRAFLTKARAHDSLAEELGEEVVATMTSGEDQSDRLEAEVAEDKGGPFIITTGAQEFAGGEDASNPSDATREPFPKT